MTITRFVRERSTELKPVTGPINDLPSDITGLVLSFLPRKDASSFGVTCKRRRKAAVVRQDRHGMADKVSVLSGKLLTNYLIRGVVVEIPRIAIALVVIEKRSQRKIIDKREVVRLRVPEMTAFIIIEINSGSGGKDILVTKVEFINRGVRGIVVVPVPGAVFDIGRAGDRAAEGIA